MSNKLSTQKIVFIGMFVAIIAILSQCAIPSPTGVPMTLQPFGIALTGYLLRKKYAPMTVIIWLLLGAVGVPVFSGFRSGPNALIGATSGFMYGFIIMSFLCGLSSLYKPFISITFGLLGLFITHILGTVVYSNISGNNFIVSITTVSLPYIIKDIILVILAYFISKVLHIRLNKASIKFD